MWSIHAVDYDSALKKEDTLTHATAWATLQDSTPSETGQIQKGQTVHASAYTRTLEEIDSQTEEECWFPEKAGGGNGCGFVFRGDGVSVWEDDTVLEMTVVMGAQPCEWTSCH